MEAIVECKVDNVIDFSVDIAWKPIEMDDEEESKNEEQEVKEVVEPLRILLFCERMKKLSLHFLLPKKWMKDCTIF